jgi:hypothetical protein
VVRQPMSIRWITSPHERPGLPGKAPLTMASRAD